MKAGKKAMCGCGGRKTCEVKITISHVVVEDKKSQKVESYDLQNIRDLTATARSTSYKRCEFGLKRK